jgi:hypothetical protein
LRSLRPSDICGSGDGAGRPPRELYAGEVDRQPASFDARSLAFDSPSEDARHGWSEGEAC